jgi:hypothetical protein
MENQDSLVSTSTTPEWRFDSPAGACNFPLLHGDHDWLWGPPTLLSTEYRELFPRG